MKANYLPRNRARNPYLKRIITLAGIFIFGAIVFSFLDTAIISAISPLWQAENVVSRNLRNSSSFFRSNNALLEEKVSLEERIMFLETQLAALSSGRIQEETLL